MTTETKHNLSDETIEALQDLIQVNIDSANGFSEAAEQLEDVTLVNLFVEMGGERRNLATELQTHVQQRGEQPVKDGSFLAKVHRVWLDLRAKLNGGDAHVILCEAERGEDYIKQAYEDALQETAGSALNDVLLSQYSIIKAGHDRIRDLRDHYKAS